MSPLPPREGEHGPNKRHTFPRVYSPRGTSIRLFWINGSGKLCITDCAGDRLRYAVLDTPRRVMQSFLRPPLRGLMFAPRTSACIEFPRQADSTLVPGAGVEPARHRWRGILSPVRLPIPPPGQVGTSNYAQRTCIGASLAHDHGQEGGIPCARALQNARRPFTVGQPPTGRPYTTLHPIRHLLPEGTPP